MNIKRGSRIGGIVCLLCIVVLVACAVQVIRSISAMEEFAQKRFDSILLAQEVRATSSGLTANARAYVSTGDSAYEKAYWDLVKIRSGEIPRPAEAAVAPGERIPMKALLERAGFTDEELALLMESVKISSALVLLEEQAMNAVKGLFQGPSGAYTVQGPPDPALAQRLMFGKEYDATVDRIMIPSHNFDNLVNKRINAGYAGVLATLGHAVIALCVAVAVMAVLAALGVYMLLRRIIAPVSAGADFAHAVAEGALDTPPPAFNFSEGNEIGQMLTSLQRMVSNLKDRIDLAENKSREAEEQGKRAADALEEALEAKNSAEAGREAIFSTAANVEQVVRRLFAATEELFAQVEESARSTNMERERVASSATAMEQMSFTVREVSSRAGTAAEKSDNAREKARQGDEIMRQSVESIITVQHDTQELKEKMEALGSRADSIGDIMTVISDIADQTNLLALNAAIEAARAGEAGRGFAVVADEVRKLAEKTMTATKEVGEAINGIQAGTRQSIITVERTTGNLDSATELVRRSGDALVEIVHEITETAAQVSSIASVAEEQSAGSEKIARSLEEINTMAEGTAMAMQQASHTVSELSGQAQELQMLVENLRK
jgi:methyl-accepting chemotaxis protein